MTTATVTFSLPDPADPQQTAEDIRTAVVGALGAFAVAGVAVVLDRPESKIKVTS